MSFFNARFFSRSVFTVCLWLAPVCGGVVRGEPEGGPDPAGNPAVVRLQAELPERKFQKFDGILRRALVYGPSVVMREWEAAAAAENARGARAPMLPSLNASANAGATREQRSGGAGYDRSFTAILYQVSFYQPVYHWGALGDNYKIGQLRQAVADRNTDEARRLLAIDIRRRYFDIILAANGVELARDKLDRLLADRKNMEQLIADGARAPGEIDGANRAVDAARPELEQAKNQFDALRLSLAQIAGVPESEFDDLPDAIPGLGNIADALNALAAGVSAPPSAQLRDIHDDIGIEKLSLHIHKTRQLPKFGFAASVAQQPDNSNVAQKSLLTSWNASVSVNWNIFDGFASQAAKRHSLNRLRALETRRDLFERQESAERRAEMSRLLVQWEQLRNAERDLDRARAGAEIAGRDFESGMASRRAVEDARDNHARTLHHVHAARASFYTALAACLSNRGLDPVLREVAAAAK